MSKKILIIGSVAAGASSAARLRRLDEKADIIMFEMGPYMSYANCGLAYAVGKVIADIDFLLVQTPEEFNERFNVDVRINNEAVKIDRHKKEVHIHDLQTGRKYTETYDKLILAPGAEPVVPAIDGIDSKRVFTIKTIPDTERIKSFIETEKPKKALIIGAGYIGLEMAENLARLGISVGIIEALNQPLAFLDAEMSNIISKHLVSKNVALWLGEKVLSIKESKSGLTAKLSSGSELDCDFVVCAAGVRPRTELANDAGLAIGKTGGIKVDEYLRTNDHDIYAAGDAIETADTVLGMPRLNMLAGPANKQGRIAADNICGRNVKYKTAPSTAIVNIFELTAATTGANETQLRQCSIPYEKIYLHPFHHGTYYPGAKQMSIKLLFSKPDGRILGAQIVGREGVDKRIDIIATAIYAGQTVFDLQNLELAYAPQYGSAKDPINMAGFAAANSLDGTVDIKHISGLEDSDFVLDVRTLPEAKKGMIPKAVHIPLDELRSNLTGLPKDRTIYVYCGTGLRSYIAARILKQNGFDVKNLPGGYMTYMSNQGVNPTSPELQSLRAVFLAG